MKKILILFVTLLTLFGCGSKPKSNVVRIGLHGGDQTKSWNYVVEQAAQEGINIELVYFSDYPQPNAALNSKEIDMNAFQHHIYLEDESQQNGYELTAVADTFYSPLGLYSRSISDLSELKEGDKIAIPSDRTNGARALQLLQTHGLLKLNDAKLPDKKDIIENPHNFDIFELEASNLPGALAEVPLAAINSGIAVDAGFTPNRDALKLETLTEENADYVNLIAIRTEDKDRDDLKRIVELYKTDAVKALIIEETSGASVPVF
ncbi:MetQ/NlpA family ABC transporter substrate-binding protein [Erysipelothrix piscisicarius]|uniref:MetQ/NlpA family ABC transporter substrate-binding protein n=1 Tax=Erysipelothrix piscisicarius TaxID=2485784 RepID=A0A3S8RLA1_9FIRM|nr:MetQ/NlpA family ABC transporter substrate-binding protein [Erysipelothrix piscisicarius]AZK43695.1 MetQ/NlpA family ABC transporter substrate-binding protein [Erysipelothrix piscisicarius]